MAKTYTITKTRRGNKTSKTGTLEELIEYHNYTLIAGNSYNKRVNTKPKTAKSLVVHLNRAVEELQIGSYDPNYYELS